MRPPPELATVAWPPRGAWLLAAVTVHGGLAALLLSQPRTETTPGPAPFSVSLLAPAEAEAPRPQPRPAPPQRAPQPSRTASPSAAAAPANAVSSEAPPSPAAAPAATATPSPSLVPPRFDAAYLNNPAPAYPPMSRRAGEQGKTLLRVLVSAAGLAEQVEIRQSSGFPRLDAAAEEAVRRWRFSPARLGGETQAAWVLVPISFILEK